MLCFGLLLLLKYHIEKICTNLTFFFKKILWYFEGFPLGTERVKQVI